MAKNIPLISIFLFFSCTEKDKSVSSNDIFGCSDPISINYNSSATIDDGSCLYSGCTEISAINYDSTATVDDGNCIFEESIVEGYQLFWNDEFNLDSLNL